jgi:hypothetical protein
MTQKLYVVYDVKSETYTSPTVNPARGQAIRSFGDAVNGGESVLSSHPEDFTLFEIGSFDPNTGEISLYDAKEAVANGLDLKLETENNS